MRPPPAWKLATSLCWKTLLDAHARVGRRAAQGRRTVEVVRAPRAIQDIAGVNKRQHRLCPITTISTFVSSVLRQQDEKILSTYFAESNILDIRARDGERVDGDIVPPPNTWASTASSVKNRFKRLRTLFGHLRHAHDIMTYM